MLSLASYVQVMRLPASAMTLLRGETTSYIGKLIRTILNLNCKFNQTTDRLVESLVIFLSARIDRHFQAIFSDAYLIVLLLHPQFKFKSLPENARRHTKRQVLRSLRWKS